MSLNKLKTVFLVRGRKTECYSELITLRVGNLFGGLKHSAMFFGQPHTFSSRNIFDSEKKTLK